MSSAKIMIVEDNTTVARDIRECLEGLGYGVTCVVASGEESIEKADKERPDAVLMDIRLRDEMDGIEAAEQIHARYGIPVVFLSAHSDRTLLERAKRVGSFGYLVKPFEEDELYATLEMALYKVKADASLLAASRMEATATLAGGIAHDYNNLMSVVMGYAEHVRGELGKGHPNAGMLLEIEGAARKAGDLAESLLAFARGGAREVGKRDLNQIVSEKLRSAERSLPHQIEITCDLAEDLWTIRADRSQLDVILTGLLANAVEAIEGEGKIDITTRNVDIEDTVPAKGFAVKAGRYTVLKVEDTGCGMNNEILGKVFEPFFSTKFQGRGLGMASIYGIVKNHGGYIVMESKEKEGASCTIYFPVFDDEVDDATLPQRAQKAEGVETILVVDDEEMLLKMASLMLTRLGYQVLTANGGHAALEILHDHERDVHLVLLDMNMRGMDGPTAFPRLKKERPEMKVLLFSGYELDETVQALLDAGANGFLKKPVASKKLGSEIRRALDA
jgi:two-component system, cell cycle sensor histidine kinase and response regulator CckA